MASFLVINFTRPEKTARVLKTLDNCKDLLLFCDGPGKDIEKNLEVKRLLQECADRRTLSGLKTQLRFEPTNLGPRNGPLTAIRWFFQEREKGHVIEDDLLPAPSFESAHERGLEIIEQHPNIFCVGEGHPLPKCKHQWLITRSAKLGAWSSTREKIEPFLARIENKTTPWSKLGPKLTQGLQPKTQIFLWKEFYRLSKRPAWSWAYAMLQIQLELKLEGLTPTTRFHENRGVDGSGANCINLFGEYEKFSATELQGWDDKKPTADYDHVAEHTMEWARYGRIHQSLGRIFYKMTPKRFKNLWKPAVY